MTNATSPNRGETQPVSSSQLSPEEGCEFQAGDDDRIEAIEGAVTLDLRADDPTCPQQAFRAAQPPLSVRAERRWRKRTGLAVCLLLLAAVLSSSPQARTSELGASATTSTFRSVCLATSGRPKASERPRITGAPYVGGRLEGSRGGDWCGEHPIQLHLRWKRCRRSGCSPIVGATRSSYVPGRRDVGKTIVFSVTAMSPSGTTTVKSNGKRIGRARLAYSSPPTISGTSQAALVLTTSTGTWTGSQPVVYGYQWLRCDSTGSGCAAVEGEVASSYRLVAGDVGSTIRARVTATNTSGSKSATSAPTDVVSASSAGAPPLNTAPPTIAGTVTEGLILNATTGVWAGTTRSHTPTNGDAATRRDPRVPTSPGAQIRCTCSALSTSARRYGSRSRARTTKASTRRRHSPPRSSPPPRCLPRTRRCRGSRATPPWAQLFMWTWEPGREARRSRSRTRWRRCDGGGGNCVSVAGATSAEYSVVYADGGSTLRVLITAANDFGSAASQSSPTQVVSKPSVYWGAYIDGDPTYDYYYGGSWGDAPWDAEAWARFESNAGKKVSIVHWGLRTPWAHDFKYFLGPFNLVHQAGDLNLVDMTTASVPLRDVANGAYDPELKTWFQQAAAWGHPFFLALDIEMNGPWEPYAPGVNGNTAPDFVAMWRHVHDLATAAGAGNVTWTWCPNIDNGNKFTPYEKLYPGDAYVDWTCLHGYNKTGNDSFSSVFTTSYQKLLTLAPTKPIMIGETGAVEGGLGKAAWIKDALVTQLPRYFPRVKALVWFNWRILEDGKWWEWPIESSASAQDAFRSAIGSSYYAAGGGFNNLPAGSKIQEP